MFICCMLYGILYNTYYEALRVSIFIYTEELFNYFLVLVLYYFLHLKHNTNIIHFVMGSDTPFSPTSIIVVNVLLFGTLLLDNNNLLDYSHINK